MSSEMDIKQYLHKKNKVIDSFISDYFKRQFKPIVLHEAMSYSLFAGGKRIRPILALASYEACGGNSDEIVPYASSLELLHTYSLIHDDLPSMDDDDLRRGKPTNHKVFGEAIATLAGDALLTEVFSILSGIAPPDTIKETNILRAIREISEAAGPKGMVAGQVQDLISENGIPDQETLEFIHMHKTTALICASVKLGPILHGSSKETLDALTEYGSNVGLAFQIIDDILDIEGNSEDIGKPVGSDEKVNKMTYPRLYGVEKSREIAAKHISEAISSISTFSEEADPLRGIALYILDRRN
jgi:geranylgeranyl diphosphate synthase type II